MTDIDDTLIESGKVPDAEWIDQLAGKIRILKKHNILWIPMSGVAIVKLGPRILYRLPEDVWSHVMYYGGDGSQKYYYDTKKNEWAEDKEYRRIMTDAQSLAVIGKEEFLKSVNDSERYEAARKKLIEGRFSGSGGFLSEMKQILYRNGFDPGESETYFRGGSVSWMMLGDTSAEPYKTENAVKVRMQLFEYAEKRLLDEDYLERFGSTGLCIPFHGARGVKFVLRGNDKERGTLDLIEKERIPAEMVFFAGNELFSGGNDNMIRNIQGVTLLSVGEKNDPGDYIVDGGYGIEANYRWMNSICSALEKGEEWGSILTDIRERGSLWLEDKNGRSF